MTHPFVKSSSSLSTVKGSGITQSSTAQQMLSDIGMSSSLGAGRISGRSFTNLGRKRIRDEDEYVLLYYFLIY